MIGRIERFLLKTRRLLSRSEWAVRLLGLDRSLEGEEKPGLLMVQIDGLSLPQLQRAMKSGHMPYLRGLCHREGYRLHSLYSGLPSNTPAFQGELFYGVRYAVPAFSFRDHRTHRLVRMFEPQSAAALQAQLEKTDPGLLRGGSAYSDVYTGGATGVHFCVAGMGWSSPYRAAHPVIRAFFILIHLFSLFRVGLLLILEWVLAVVDFFRGLIAGQDLFKELKFVLSRVAVSILLRELITIGSKIDLARGVRLVHLNFLGYDEQAHRRGPESAFAHWSLKGIDRAIRRIHRAACRSARREYELWVYSDHGQERTIPFEVENGRSIYEAVGAVLGGVGPSEGGRQPLQEDLQQERARWVRDALSPWLGWMTKKKAEIAPTTPLVTALGPLGHVYPGRPLTDRERHQMGEDLVHRGGIPLVLAAEGTAEVRAWNRSGSYRLPEEASAVLGPDHPFLEEAAADLASLCRHPDAGTFIISGWRWWTTSVSFPVENGAHAGPGYEETHAFALLPASAPVAPSIRDALRPIDLRHGVSQFLLSPLWQRVRRPRRACSVGRSVRVMTYNVHSCLGMDGRVSPDRIARVIAHCDPDLVALQELDVGRVRTGEVDQAHEIAMRLEMDYHFHPALRLEEEKYGDAVLSRWPMRLVRAAGLPGPAGRPGLEPRGAIWVTVQIDGREMQLINTHLGLYPSERLIQVEALLGADWLGHPDCRGAVIFCGDFNALPGSRPCRRIEASLRDVQRALEGHHPLQTWFGRYPVRRIDHVYIGEGMSVVGLEVPRTALTRIASDHLPLIAEVCLP